MENKKPIQWAISILLSLFVAIASQCIIALIGTQVQSTKVIYGVIAVVLCIFAIVATAFFYLSSEGTEITFGESIKQVLLLLVVGILEAAIISLLYGLVSMLLGFFLIRVVGLDTTLVIVNIILSIFTALLIPLFVSAFFGARYSGDSTFKGIQFGIKHTPYGKLLIVSVICTVIGYLLSMFLTAGTGFFGFVIILRIVILSLVGGISLVLSGNICANKYAEEIEE